MLLSEVTIRSYCQNGQKTEVESFEVEKIITLLIRSSSSCRLSQIETLPKKQRRLAGDASVDWLRDPDHVRKKNSNPCDWVVFHFRDDR